MNKIPFVLIFLVTVCFCEMPAQRRFRIAEYNVENLFDTIHAEGFQDEEFTPCGSRQWTSGRYWKKLGRLARTIAEIGDIQPADIVVLCEVEGDSVMRDLTQRTMLRRLGYEYIISHSIDIRGIDVAVLYQPLSFMPVQTDSLRVSPPPGFRTTRDILHVCGITISGDTLDIFAVHMPSRNGGSRQTSPFREKVAGELRNFTDSIRSMRCCPNIVILGDFNDEASDKSIRRSLGAIYNKVYTPKPEDLVVFRSKCDNPEIRGTYRFRRKWYELDHIVVSGNLLVQPCGMRLTEECAHIYSSEYLVEKEGRRGYKPRRTFLGNFYHGGLSDHLPIYIDLTY